MHYLIHLTEPKTIMALSKELNQSRRKIYYHLDKINEALPDNVSPITSLPRVGLILDEEQKVACQKLLDELDGYSYVLTIDERAQMILIYIGVARDKVTIEKIMNLTEVSRNTVLNDLQEIRRTLQEDIFGISLQVDKMRGYILEGPALAKIQYFHSLLQKIVYEGNAEFNDLVRLKIKESSPDNLYFSEAMQTYFSKQVKQLTHKLGKTVNPNDRQFMVRALPYLLSVCRNMTLGEAELASVLREFSLARERREYSLVQDFAKSIFDNFGIQLNELEKSVMAMLILSFRKDRDEHVDSQDYTEMRQQLDEFLTKFEKRSHKTFSRREMLLDQLVTHCKAMVYRKTYGILLVNPLTKQIKKRYGQLFEQTKACVDVLEHAWLISMSDDDIAYLAMHLGGDLRNSAPKKKAEKELKITLVCDEGVAVQKFLLQQCLELLPSVQIEAVFTTEQFHSVRDLLTADLVITTSDVANLSSPVPILKVNTIMTDEDKVRVVRFLRRGEADYESLEGKLKQLYRPFIKNEDDIYILVKEVEKLIYQELLKDIKNL